MTGYDIYTFTLCLIVFIILASLFSYMIYMIITMQLKLTKHGHMDDAITKEYEKERNTRPAVKWLSRILSWLMCLVFLVAFCFSMWMNATKDRPANGIPSIKVVKSESMSRKHEANPYLEENGLDDQIQMFDLIVCHHLPAEEELELYDIVVYKWEDTHIIHRIIGIEEPNEKHPNERHFLLKGDANKYDDEFPVRYSQMQGIYKGIRIPLVGSFVMFMQSPSGWLVILLVLFATIATPLMEKNVRTVRDQRLTELGVIVPEPEADDQAEQEAGEETEVPEHEAQ